MGKDHGGNEKKPADRIAHTTAFIIPVMEHWLEQEIAHRSTLNDQSNDLSHIMSWCSTMKLDISLEIQNYPIKWYTPISMYYKPCMVEYGHLKNWFLIQYIVNLDRHY